MEEIEDVNVDSGDPLLATALANETELDLSEEQKKNFKKVNYWDVLINIVCCYELIIIKS